MFMLLVKFESAATQRNLTSSVAGPHTEASFIGLWIVSVNLCVGKVCKKWSLVSEASPWSLWNMIMALDSLPDPYRRDRLLNEEYCP
jgi:hypothetical protein